MTEETQKDQIREDREVIIRKLLSHLSQFKQFVQHVDSAVETLRKTQPALT